MSYYALFTCRGKHKLHYILYLHLTKSLVSYLPFAFQMRAQAQKGAVTRTCEFSGPRAGLSPLSTTQSQAEPWCPLDLADVLHVKLICDLYEFMCVFFCQLFSLMFLAFSAWNRKTKGF